MRRPGHPDRRVAPNTSQRVQYIAAEPAHRLARHRAGRGQMWWAPSARARWAVARPIPALPPMTSTVYPSKAGSRTVAETSVAVVMKRPPSDRSL